MWLKVDWLIYKIKLNRLLKMKLKWKEYVIQWVFLKILFMLIIKNIMKDILCVNNQNQEEKGLTY